MAVDFRPLTPLIERHHAHRLSPLLRPLAALAAGVLLVLSVTGGLQAAPPPDPQRWVSGEVLIQPRVGAPPAAVDRALRAQGARPVGELRNLSVLRVRVPPRAEAAIARALARHPAIEFAEVNAIVEPIAVPDDPYYPNQWHLPKIGGPAAWDITRGAGVVVAVLDTGVEASHPDLATQLVGGWNTVRNNTDTSPVHPHGTQVAGTTAAAGNNALGVASVAWNAQIMPIKVTTSYDGSATISDLAEGVVWAADHGARVANASYSGVAGSSTFATAAAYMQDRGGVVVVAAGNTGTQIYYPDSPYSIAVSASTSTDVKASWSSYGEYVDVAAPGSSLLSTTTGGAYAYVSGTSFASPTTAGVVALIMATNPNLTPAAVEQILESTAYDLGAAGWDPLYGHGRVDAAAAVLAAGGVSDPDVEAPAVAISSPTGGTVSGLVPVEVTATDDIGVEYVELLADGQVVARDEVAPFAFAWDSTAVEDGPVTLSALAADAAGNVGQSDPVSVTVENGSDSTDTVPPLVSIIFPPDGSVVTRTVWVVVSASDEGGLAGISLFIDDATTPVVTTSRTLLIYTWDTRTVSLGDHTLRAEATDLAGNTQTTQISVTVR